MKFITINSIAKNSNFAFFLRIFDEFFSGFRAKFQIIVTCTTTNNKNSDVCRFFNQIWENKSEICRKFWILWKNSLLFKTIHFTPYLRRSPPARGSRLSRPSRMPSATGKKPEEANDIMSWLLNNLFGIGNLGSSHSKRFCKISAWKPPLP